MRAQLSRWVWVVAETHITDSPSSVDPLTPLVLKRTQSELRTSSPPSRGARWVAKMKKVKVLSFFFPDLLPRGTSMSVRARQAVLQMQRHLDLGRGSCGPGAAACAQLPKHKVHPALSTGRDWAAHALTHGSPRCSAPNPAVQSVDNVSGGRRLEFSQAPRAHPRRGGEPNQPGRQAGGHHPNSLRQWQRQFQFCFLQASRQWSKPHRLGTEQAEEDPKGDGKGGTQKEDRWNCWQRRGIPNPFLHHEWERALKATDIGPVCSALCASRGMVGCCGGMWSGRQAQTIGQVAALFFPGLLARGSRLGEFLRSTVATALQKVRQWELLPLPVLQRWRCFAENVASFGRPASMAVERRRSQSVVTNAVFTCEFLAPSQVSRLVLRMSARRA